MTVEAGFDAFGQVCRIGGGAGDRDQVDRALGPADGETAVGKDDFGGVGLQQPGGDRPALGDDRLGRLEEGAAAEMHRARTAMPGTFAHEPRVGLDIAKTVERQTEQRSGDLRVAGLVALAVRLGAEDQRHLAVGVEADFRTLVRGAARGFEKAAKAQATQPAALRRAARRSAKPAASAAASSRLAANRPQSMVIPSALR